MLETEVFSEIKHAGQEPHWAYSKGMSRLSCMFCIMANPQDLKISAEQNPETYAQYVAMEKKINHTMMMPVKGVALGLEEITGVDAMTQRELENLVFDIKE